MIYTHKPKQRLRAPTMRRTSNSSSDSLENTSIRGNKKKKKLRPPRAPLDLGRKGAFACILTSISHKCGKLFDKLPYTTHMHATQTTQHTATCAGAAFPCRVYVSRFLWCSFAAIMSSCVGGLPATGLFQGEESLMVLQIVSTLISFTVVSAWVNRDKMKKLSLFFAHWLA